MEYQIVSNVAEKTSLAIDDEMTVGEVRTIIELMLEVPEGIIMTMTYCGKMLFAPEDALLWKDIATVKSTAKVPKIYCNVTGKQKTEDGSAEAIRAVFPSLTQRAEEERAQREQARAMAPMMESMAQNPEMLTSMHPGLKKMMKENPDFARQIKDPEVMKEMMMSQMDPDKRRMMNRSMELAFSQISNVPGGQQMFERYLHGFLRDEENMVERTDVDLHTTSSELAQPDPTLESNSAALPNPWQQPPPPQPQPQQLGGGMGANPFFGFAPPWASNSAGGPPMNTGGVPAVDPAMMQMMQAIMANSQAPPAAAAAPTVSSTAGADERPVPPILGENDAATEAGTVRVEEPQPDFTEQLETLHAMGFTDDEQCKRALRACKGDVEAAVDFIAEEQV